MKVKYKSPNEYNFKTNKNMDNYLYELMNLFYIFA